jgi:hypothetical protein
MSRPEAEYWEFVGGRTAAKVMVTVNYVVTRVKLAGLAAG